VTITADSARLAMDSAAVHESDVGAILLQGNRCLFRVWAPAAKTMDVHLISPAERLAVLSRDERGYFEAVVEDVAAGTRYKFRINGELERPDPASRLQPDGVHEASQVVDSAFEWSDRQWQGLPFEQYVIYELHVGTFTEAGTFEAIIPRLDDLHDLGITAIELLPIAQFPGTRNWGYDGVYPYAAQFSYGGPHGLRRLVDACHTRGMAIVLDVVYNHLGPEGNYFSEYGPYFTDRYKTAWGQAMNFDGPRSDDVRSFFVGNALMWVDDFHVDALRVDAVHAIVDHSAEPFLQDLCEAVRKLAAQRKRKIWSIAESDLNAPRVLLPRSVGGLGFDSQWNDDFHHSLHTLLTREHTGYYQDFGRASDLAGVLISGYLFTGQHSRFRQRRYGAKPEANEGWRFVVSAQNHDQVGNRMMGDRLAASLSFEQLQLCAAALILSPFVPMLFMGEEYGETAPFSYFTSHSDSDLIEAVRRGRREEFEPFEWQGEAPDPHDEETFRRSRLDWSLWRSGDHARLRKLHRDLLRLRREHAVLSSLDLTRISATADDAKKVVIVRRWIESPARQVVIVLNFGEREYEVELGSGPWRLVADNSGVILPGPLPEAAEAAAPHRKAVADGKAMVGPSSFAVFESEGAPAPSA
jgi:maltooligosyltrehalose trehalohydrolase